MGSWFEHVEDIVAQNQKEIEQQRMKVCFNLPATVANTPHREPLIQLCPMPDNSLLLVGQDGLISTWTQDLKLKKNRLILDENKNQIRKMKWVSDSTVMIQFKKLVIATSDREIRIYELSNNFEPYCQIVGFETIPLHMGFSTRNKDEGLIYFGDEQGCVNIIVADHMAEALRKWSKCPMVDETPTVSIQDIVNPDHVQFIRWKVHNDWVTQIKYIPSMQSIISCSNDDYTALVVGCVEESKNVQMQLKDIFEQSSMKSKRTIVTGNVPPKRNSWDEKLFRVRRGVKTFDYSNESNIIVTGGLDRIVRLWNPYLPEWAIGVMHGHSSPIVYVRIGDENSKIYSVSEHCAVMVWDIENRTCLTRVIPQAIPIRGQLATCFLSLHQRTLFMASDTLVALQVQQIAKQPYHLSTTHSEPVTSCQYNGQYQQVVSCSEGSAIKLWDIRTGQLLFELKGAHGNSAISCLALDKTCSRMLTGGRDGSLNKWLYGEKNIKFIGTVKKAKPEEEINDCTYAVLHDKWYILYVGWDRYVHFIPESMDAVDSANLPPRRKSKGHTEEILCVASWPDNFVATSSFDGEVILWNLISGKMFWRLKPPNDENLERGTDDLIINRVIFLYTRLEQKKESAILVASGPRGQITFWNIFGGGKIFGRFPGSLYNSVVKDITLSEDETLLCAADQLYYVYIWQIKQYALHGPEEKPPALLSCWRAHTSDITRVIPLSLDRLVITSSLDCTVKLWSLTGSHIGTFGQNLPWNVLEKETWKQQGCDNSTTTPGLLPVETTGTKPNPSNVENNAGITAELTGSSQSTDDNDILEELKKIHILKSENRVRIIGPKKVEIQQTCGRLNAYKSLKIADLINPPYNIQKPNPAAELNDQFDLSF